MKTENFQKILIEAVSHQGKILEAYRAFPGYSFGNQLLALSQCESRGLTPGPLSTFLGWADKGRTVKRGEKALALVMPITFKKEKTEQDDQVVKIFQLKNRWFTLAQTEGEEIQIPEIPEFNIDQALEKLQITRAIFDSMNGNKQGYARDRSIAISQLARLPLKTTFHEVAHIMLGHTESAHSEHIPKNIMEVEAESVALICLTALELEGAEYCRGYIQHWLEDEVIPEKNAGRILSCADKILSAGRKKDLH